KAFGVDPIRAPPGAIRFVDPLRDDAFEPHAAGVLEQSGAFRLEMLAQPDGTGLGEARENLRQLLLAFQQWAIAQVCSIAKKQVERVIPELPEAAFLQCGLQGCEARCAGCLLDDELAVDNGRSGRNAIEGFRKGAEFLRPIETLPGQELDLVAALAHLDAITVEFDLVHPFAAGWWAVGELCEAWLDEVRQIGFLLSDILDRSAADDRLG